LKSGPQAETEESIDPILHREVERVRSEIAELETERSEPGDTDQIT
jgi:hypothetical protein